MHCMHYLNHIILMWYGLGSCIHYLNMISRAVPNILLVGRANIKYRICENFWPLSHEVSRYRIRFLLYAKVCVLTAVTADSRTFEDHQITNGVARHYLSLWPGLLGGGAAAPCPVARYGLDKN